MPFDSCIDDTLVNLCPNLQNGEGPGKFTNNIKLRDNTEIFNMLDLHFRLHWWVRDAELNGYSSEPVNLSIIQERRKSLEWVMDCESDWDNIELNT